LCCFINWWRGYFNKNMKSLILPQVVKIFRTKQTKDLSLITFSMLSMGVFLWLIYGILIKEFPVIAANSVTLILALLIVIMKIKYG